MAWCSIKKQYRDNYIFTFYLIVLLIRADVYHIIPQAGSSVGCNLVDFSVE